MIKKLLEKLSQLVEALSRYPLTVIFLVAAAIINAMSINQNVDYSKWLLTFLMGGFLGMTLQVFWERFFNTRLSWFLTMGMALILTLGYFLLIENKTTIGVEIEVRTGVILLILLVAYIWVPVIKSELTFNESFMASFKAFFMTALFAGVLFLGCVVIITAIDQLLWAVSDKAFIHTLNVIGFLFAPVYFLSLGPVYPGASDKNRSSEKLKHNRKKLENACSCPKFLEILISYILIPLIFMYTVILIVYIIKNITGSFWTDNLLEPMLIGFAVTVILIYILASNFENKFAVWFRKVFPKLLIPIVLFQIAASVLKIQDTGITYSRYYVIIFGIFAAISGVVMSVNGVRKNGIIAAVLIGILLFSLIPPVDAFTISRTNQIDRLTNVLGRNGMLQTGDVVVANTSLSETDQKIIADTVDYLVMMEYSKNIPYLGEQFDMYNDFYNTFGFYYDEKSNSLKDSVFLNLDRQEPIDISNYDTLIEIDFYEQDQKVESDISYFKINGKKYALSWDKTADFKILKLTDEINQDLIQINMKEVFDYYNTVTIENSQLDQTALTANEATFIKENNEVAIALVAKNLNIEKSAQGNGGNGSFYVLIKIR